MPVINKPSVENITDVISSCTVTNYYELDMNLTQLKTLLKPKTYKSLA